MSLPYKKGKKINLRKKLGNKCEICGGTEKLQFHHKNPKIKNGKDKVENLRLLCKECHKREHIENEDKYKVPFEEYIKIKREKYYKKLKDIWVPDNIGWHQLRFQIDGEWKKFYCTNKRYYIKKLIEKNPETVFYSTIRYYCPKKYRSSKENLPGYTTDRLILGGLICFDFDREFDIEGLTEAKEEMLKFLEFLKGRGERIKYIIFSGSKGGHIVIEDPFSLPADPRERQDRMREHRKLYIQQIINEYGKCPFDRPIAEDIHRFIRAPGTVHSKTGFISTFIDEELLKYNLDDFLSTIPHVNGDRPEIPRREMTITPPHKRKGDGKGTGPTFHLQTFITNRVIGTKDRFIPIFRFERELQKIDMTLKRVIRQYRLTDVYIFRDKAATYALCLKTFDKKRLKKIMKASTADNRTHGILRMPISDRISAEGIVYEKPEFIGKINSKTKAYSSLPHITFLKKMHNIEVNDDLKHGSDSFKMTTTRIKVDSWQ